MTSIKSLSALVHASPAYHRVYLTAREEILTCAALAHYAAHGLNLSRQPKPSIEQHHIFEYLLHYRISNATARVIHEYYQQLSMGVPHVKLSVQDCIKLFSCLSPRNVLQLSRTADGRYVIDYGCYKIHWKDENPEISNDEWACCGASCELREKRTICEDDEWVLKRARRPPVGGA